MPPKPNALSKREILDLGKGKGSVTAYIPGRQLSSGPINIDIKLILGLALSKFVINFSIW